MPEKIPGYFIEFTKDFQEFKIDVKDRLSSIEDTLKIHSNKFETIENKLDSHDREFVNIKDKLDSHDKEFVSIKSKLDSHDKEFVNIKDKLDSHFETIGEIKVQVTEINLMLPNKANYEYAIDIDERTKKIEKLVFA